MMGRSVIGDDSLLIRLKKISKDSGFSFGLILGQSTAQKDYIVHFAPTPPPPEYGEGVSECGDIRNVQDIGDYEGSWIGSHTRNVMKMLPGGMSVLGVYVTCSNSPSDTAVFNKLRALAIHSYNSTKNNSFLHINKNSSKLLLQYSVNNKTYVCKSLDAGSLNASLQPVDLKFSSEPFKWYEVDSSINLVNFGPYFVEKSKENFTLKKMLKEMLSVIQGKIDGCECSVDGKFVDLADDLKSFKDKEERKIKELEKSTGEKVDFNSKAVIVQLYGRELPGEYSFKVDHLDHHFEVSFDGDISSKVFTIGSSSLEDIIKAVKEDLIRCCSTKFEMHWETNDAPLIGSKNGERTNEVHMLPRRVLFTLPDSTVKFSEYLFLDESAEDIVPSIQEQLGLQIDLSSVLDVLEPSCDMSIPSQPDKALSKTSKGRSSEHYSNNLFIVSVAVASVIVLLVSLYIQFS